MKTTVTRAEGAELRNDEVCSRSNRERGSAKEGRLDSEMPSFLAWTHSTYVIRRKASTKTLRLIGVEISSLDAVFILCARNSIPPITCPRINLPELLNYILGSEAELLLLHQFSL